MKENDKVQRDEGIYDYQNLKLLGKVEEGTEFGRWTLGYYYSAEIKMWILISNYWKIGQNCSDLYKEVDAEKCYFEESSKLQIIVNRALKNIDLSKNPSNEEMKKEYEKQISKYYADLDANEKRNKERLRLSDPAVVAHDISSMRKDGYVDYIQKFSRKTTPRGHRTDSVCMTEDGDVIFQGMYGHENYCYLIATSIGAIEKKFYNIMNLIQMYCQGDFGHVLTIDFAERRKSDREIMGYIEHQISLDDLSAEDILNIYAEDLRTNAFPTPEEKAAIAKRIYSYNHSMDISHGGIQE
ncbi:hypothetical protein SAMN02910339_00002 [Lachnospiraceae bacterium YSD2013]|nr:hypothetical protein SAMN02910339_00002 [Lachnospiraceae bacterium YSD2013]